MLRAAPGWGPPKGSFDEGFARMATVEKMPMLQMGYDKLSEQLRELKAERPLIVDAIEEARAHGDLSENAEYHASKERPGQVEATIAARKNQAERRERKESGSQGRTTGA